MKHFILFIFSCASAALASNNISFSDQNDNLAIQFIESQRPDRSKGLVYIDSHSQEQTFHEYYLSGENNQCAFFGFDTNRKDALDLIYKKIFEDRSQTTRYLLNEAINFEAIQKKQAIFGLSHVDIHGNILLENQDEKIEKYITYYRNNNVFTECAHNYNWGNQIEDTINYTILDVIGYVYKKSFIVFKKEHGQLNAIHKFNVESSPSVVYLLFKSVHYNCLIPLSDTLEKHEEALQKETIYLRNLYKRPNEPCVIEDFHSLYDYDSEATEDVFGGGVTSLIPSPQIHDTNFDTLDTGNDFLSFGESDTSSEDDDVPQHLNISRTNLESMQVDEEPNQEEIRFRFDEEDFSNFLHGKRRFLSGSSRNHAKSIELAYQYAGSKRRQATTTNEKFKYLLCQIKILVERGYLKNSQTYNGKIREKLNELQEYRKNHDTNKLLNSYATVYCIKLLKHLGEYQKAYTVFLRENNKNYTQTARIDIAEIIIDKNFTPNGCESHEAAVQYARTLLIGKHGNITRRKSIAHRSSSGSTTSHRIAHPDYLNNPQKSIIANKLKRKANRFNRNLTRRQDSQQDYAESGLSALPSIALDSEASIRRPTRQDHDHQNFRSNSGEDSESQFSNSSDELEPRRYRQTQSRTQDQDNRAHRSIINNRKRGREENQSEENPVQKKRRLDSDNDAPSSHQRFFTSSSSSSDKEFQEEDWDYAIDVNIQDQSDASEHNDFELARPQSTETYDRIKTYIYLGKANLNEKAIPYYLKALEKAKTHEIKDLEAQAYIGLGNAMYTDSRHDQNYWYLQALRIAEEIQDKTLQTQAYIGLGNAMYTDSRHDRNYWYLQALRIAEEIQDKKLQTQAYIGLGNARYTDSRHDRNYWYLQALHIAEEIQDKTLQAQAYIGLGNARYTDHDHQYDSEWYLQALHIAEEIRDTTLQAQAYIGLGNARYTNDKHPCNSEWYLQALHIAEEIQDKTLPAQAYIGLGNARYTDHDHQYDSEWYLKALHIAEEIQDKTLQAQAYIGLGNARYTDHGHQYDSKWYLKALRIAEGIQDKTLQAHAYMGLGNARYTDHDHQYDSEWYLKALRIAEELQDKKFQAQAYIRLGNARYTDNRHDRNYWYLQALHIAEEIQDKSLQAHAYMGLGNARYTDNRHHDQKDWYLQALRIAEEIQDKKLQAQAYIGLGNYYCSQKDNEKGLLYYEKALKFSPQNGKILASMERAKNFIKSGTRRDTQPHHRNQSYQNRDKNYQNRR